MKVITETDVKNKKVLVRGDLDVPLQNQKIADDYRLEVMLPTLNYLIENQARIIFVGHLGRPKGQVKEELKLKPIAEWLTAKNFPVHYCDSNCFSNQDLKIGGIMLLENLRFDPREEENDESLALELASMADIYVNECFATSHRKNTSIVGVPKYLPSFAGLRLAEEVKTLSKVLKNPQRPLIFIMGGAKNETKIPLVKKFSKIADTILLGGTLMYAQKLEGVSKVRFPVDAVRIDDIGPKSIKLFVEQINQAKTVVWNGPLGRFEEEEYSQGTLKIAQAIVESETFSIAGGGDTIAALNKFGLRNKIDFISTGGGAMLQFLADGGLPGIKALE